MNEKPKLVNLFLAYCRDYAWNKPRETPLNDRTLGRYQRGLSLVKKLVGHDLETVSDTDQLVFIQGIKRYHQGTRRVSTQIFQRYIAWGIKNGYFDCENILRGKEADIIGPNTPPKHTYIKKEHIKRFFKKLENPQLRSAFGLVYYGGLTNTELGLVKTEQVTEEGVIAYREVLKESQILPLPDRFLKEVVAYAKTREGELLFDLGASEISRRVILNQWYTAATVQTQELLGTKVKDFRLSAIRHFYEECLSVELTKEFAGVPQSKKGWLESLVDATSYHMKKVAEARSYYATSRKQQVESGERL